jgi:hypothetical protein
MKSFFNIMCLIVISSIFSSCTTIKNIEIQILNPAKIKIIAPDNIVHILEPSFTKDFKITITNPLSGNEEYYREFMSSFDSSLFLSLKESPVFQKSRLVVQKEKDFQSEMQMLSADERQKHISLTFLNLILTDSIKPPYDFEEYDFNYRYIGLYSMSYTIKAEASNMGSPISLYSDFIQDTLVWTGRGNNKEEVENNLPSPAQAISDVGKISAEAYAKIIAPYWTTENRIIYIKSNKYASEAYKSFLNNDLQNAINNWKYLYETGTKNLAAIASFNIALAYEILDDLDNSELWLNNSRNLLKSKKTDEYLQLVKNRIALRPKIDNQLK